MSTKNFCSNAIASVEEALFNGGDAPLCVIKLALEVLFPGCDASEIQVEFIDKGTFNHVIGIAMKDPSASQYVLRIPSDFERASTLMVYEVNILRYVAKHLNQPVPEVVCFDSTTNNALKMPYMIQRRLEGQQFEELWHEMNGEQKQSATRGLTQLLLDMRKIKSDRPGILSESPDIEFPAVLEKYPLDFDRRQKNSPLELARPQTTVQWFRDMCQHRKQTQVQLGTAGAQTLPFDCRPEIMIWDQIASCIEKLYEMGFMPDTAEFCLFHGDLHGCNILAKMVNDSTVEITGVIDWDMAAFGPDVLTLGTAWSTFGKILQDPICRRVCKDMMGPAYERMMPYGSQLVSSLFRILRFGISQELSLCNAQDYINAILTRDLFELPYASKPKDKLYYWGSTLYYHE